MLCKGMRLPCVTFAQVLAVAGRMRKLKAFIIQLVMEWVAGKHKLELDPKYKLPKMRCATFEDTLLQCAASPVC